MDDNSLGWWADSNPNCLTVGEVRRAPYVIPPDEKILKFRLSKGGATGRRHSTKCGNHPHVGAYVYHVTRCTDRGGAPRYWDIIAERGNICLLHPRPFPFPFPFPLPLPGSSEYPFPPPLPLDRLECRWAAITGRTGAAGPESRAVLDCILCRML